MCDKVGKLNLYHRIEIMKAKNLSETLYNTSLVTVCYNLFLLNKSSHIWEDIKGIAIFLKLLPEAQIWFCQNSVRANHLTVACTWYY